MREPAVQTVDDEPRAEDGAGWVYVLSQPHHSLHKVGLTTWDPDTRAQNLYWGKTGVPQPFELEYALYVRDPRALEQAALAALTRVNPGREFVVDPRDQVIDTLERLTPPPLMRLASDDALAAAGARLAARGLKPEGVVEGAFRTGQDLSDRWSEAEANATTAERLARDAAVVDAAAGRLKAFAWLLAAACLAAPAAAAVAPELAPAVLVIGACALALPARGLGGAWRARARVRLARAAKALAAPPLAVAHAAFDPATPRRRPMAVLVRKPV